MKHYFQQIHLLFQSRLNSALIFTIIALFISTLYSCEKQSNTTDQTTTKTATKEYIQQYIQQHPKGIELSGSNTKLVTTHVNEDGNPISQIEKNKINLLGSGTGCYPTVEPETIIESQSMMRNSCSQNDWQVYASFIISSENAIVASNPNNINQKTRGRVIVTNTSTGATVVNNTSILPVTITSIGTDPSDPGRTLYRVTFNAQSIVFSNSIQNWSLRVGLFFYTECEEESQYPYTVVANEANLGSLPVCSIVHPVYYAAPQSGMNGFIAGVLNCAICCFSPYPTQQEIQISANANFTDLRHSEVPQGQPAIPNIIGIGDYYQWLPQSGSPRYIRFRNKGSNGCIGPWSSTKTVMVP
ncbi:hypothetical protein [Phnomibacter ginsenosidimutans]|uniref:Uncharacterized protein n=1 Tax=Phnomibacter ginsenosidimutans TaxID=2676868 RepID=A0A6I6GMS5_9BACT|nr:hypothetical protein [Phnomibacter ginsenosidimutans]QGW28998.1 hypothetical protein GLV81_13600 [Phnomibacter ginsenosidimutans]